MNKKPSKCTLMVSFKCDALWGVPQGNVLGVHLLIYWWFFAPNVIFYSVYCRIFNIFPKHNPDFSSIHSELNSLLFLRMQVSVDKRQVLTVNGGPSDMDYVLYLSGTEILTLSIHCLLVFVFIYRKFTLKYWLIDFNQYLNVNIPLTLDWFHLQKV